MIYDIAIIGAGASGLMLASHLKNHKVCLIDSNDKIGAKIKISGGGKCNITNKVVSSKNYLGDASFVQSILDQLTPKAFLHFCKNNNLEVHFNEKLVRGTYFCTTSNDVISMFKRLTGHCKYYMNSKVLDVEFREHYTIKTKSRNIQAKKLVIASGGLSFTSLGASSIAFDIAKKFGHSINVLNPALVGFTVQKEQFWFKNLSGISCHVKATVENRSFEGNILFAHKGCSGPVILNSSLYWKKGKMSLDFLPNKNIEYYLKGNKKISSALPFAKRFTQEFLASIEVEDKAVSGLSEDEKEKLQELKNYEFSPAGNFGFTKAEVTKGGINTTQVNHQSMQSNLQKDLYFIGECLDVTGELGGFNFQFAWASSFVCAKHLNSN